VYLIKTGEIPIVRILKIAIPAAILMTGLLISTTSLSFAKPAYAKKEKKSCTFCHVKMGSKDLNDAGKYYKAHDHSLEGYQKK
jgi:hypothetical protein